jgi:predicted S18 family serine protease
MTIAGTERKSNPDVEAAAHSYREARDERMEHSKREKQKKLELIAVMQANKIKKYKFDDAEGEELLVAIEDKLDVSVKRTGEAASEVGEGLPSHDGSDGGVPRGLIEQAMNDSNVEEVDGDVMVPEKSAPKSKKGRRKKS